MARGLILAGLGKGIADAGSIYAGAIGRGAELQWQADRELERESRLSERELARDDRLLARQEALQKLKEEAEERKTEALRQRVIKETAQASQQADLIGAERSGKAFAGLAASSAEASAQGDIRLNQEQLQSLSQKAPDVGRQYKEMGLIESSMPLTANQRRLQRAEDEAAAAMQIGAHSSVSEALTKKRDSLLREIAEENKDARERARDELRDRQFQAMLPVRQEQAAAETTRAGAAVDRAAAAKTAAGAAVTRATQLPAPRDISISLERQSETPRKLIKDNKDKPSDRQKYEDQLSAVQQQIAALNQAASARASSGSAVPARGTSAATSAAPTSAPAAQQTYAPGDLWGGMFSPPTKDANNQEGIRQAIEYYKHNANIASGKAVTSLSKKPYSPEEIAQAKEQAAGAIARLEQNFGMKLVVPPERPAASAPARPASAAPAQPRQQTQSSSTMPAPKTKAEFDRLPSGTRYTAPDGSVRIK